MNRCAQVRRAGGFAAAVVVVVAGVGAGEAAVAQTQSHDDAVGDVRPYRETAGGKRVIDILRVQNRFRGDILTMSLRTTHLPPGNFRVGFGILEEDTYTSHGVALSYSNGPDGRPEVTTYVTSPTSPDPTCAQGEGVDGTVVRAKDKVRVQVSASSCLNDTRMVRIATSTLRFKRSGRVDHGWVDGEPSGQDPLESFGPLLRRD